MGKAARLKRTIRRALMRRDQRSAGLESPERTSAASPQTAPTVLPWPGVQAGEDDGYAALRRGLLRVSQDRDEWAGIPMTLDYHKLVIDPRYPKADELMSIGREHDDDGKRENDGASVRGVFYSHHLRSDIVVIQEKDGRVTHGVVPKVHHLKHDLETLGASVAWGIEQEATALRTLSSLVRPHTFKHYLLTGMFLETSPRSGLTYLFRRLKPTVVLDTKARRGRILCALCLHPIAYYAGSWAGAMCPTDDVIAHLMLMRGDEPMFWRRANQHAAHRPEAGI